MRLHQSPRTRLTTPRAAHEPSDADGTADDVVYADENESLDPVKEPPTTGKKKG